MGRWGMGLGVAVLLGCTVAADGNGFGPGAASASTATDAATSGGTETIDNAEDASTTSSGVASDGSDSAETTGATGPATDAATFGTGPQTSGGTDVATTGSGGTEPTAAYGPCADHDECEVGMSCLTTDPESDQGFCSPGCGAGSPPDHSACPDPPAGVTATKQCILAGFLNTCVLDCAGGLTCPASTSCIPGGGGSGPYCFGD